MGFAVSALAIVLACVPAAGEPNKVFAVDQDRRSLRGDHRGRRGRLLVGPAREARARVA
jgi:hypothetical protein